MYFVENRVWCRLSKMLNLDTLTNLTKNVTIVQSQYSYCEESKKHLEAKMDNLSDLGFLINAMGGDQGGDGDTGSMFPRSDATDLGNGAQFIPGEVTEARRGGKKVEFQQPCRNGCCWYWQMPDGSRKYHYEQASSEQLKSDHNGVCPDCGNNHISGGTMKAEQVADHGQMKAVTNTASKTGARNLLAHATHIGGSNAIYAQEAAGQQELVNSDTLPVSIDNESRAILEKAGVVFGDTVKGDDLFRYVTLPSGWKKVATDHDMWSHLVDENGAVRAEIFYKAAFYDRRANMRATKS